MNEKTGCGSVFNLDASETVAYNQPLFPAYVRDGVLSAYPDYSAVSHWHGDLEFIFVKTGEMTYNVNGELIGLSEGNGIIVNSRQLHYGFSAERHECEFVCILLSPDLLRGNEWFYQNYIEPVTENSLYPYVYLERSGWTGSVLEALERIYSSFDGSGRKPASYFGLIGEFLSVMELLCENLDVQNPASEKESAEIAALRKMITYVEEHFAEGITLESIAESGACCKSKCSQLFKKYLCDTPITYMTKLRLRKSLVGLLESDRSITEIAYEYGFCGASYYCETFQKYYGSSPLQYRKAQLGG